MPVRKKTPADVTVLKQLTQEQAVMIAQLTKERDEAVKGKKDVDGYWTNTRTEVDKMKAEMDEVHGLIDSIPGCLPRQSVVPAANDYDRDKKRDNSIMLRLASLMGALNSSRG